VTWPAVEEVKRQKPHPVASPARYQLARAVLEAAAQQRILEKAYWTETSGSATFEQARAAVYTP
jgi:hypothetical protein